MHGTASLLGVWLVAIAPMSLSAFTAWGRGALPGRMLPWVAIVWVAWSGIPLGSRRAPTVSTAACACDSVWIALPALAAAGALDVVAGRAVLPAVTMLVLAVAWIWLLGAAAVRVAADERASRVHAWTWLAAIPGAVIVARALAWSHAGGVRGTYPWLASAASLSPLAWLGDGLAPSDSSVSTVSVSGAPWPPGHSPLAACSVVVALWALAWWLARGKDSSTSTAPVQGGAE